MIIKKFKLKDIDKAIDLVINLAEIEEPCLYLYPKYMDLIIVGRECEEDSYLKYTSIIAYKDYDYNANMFINEVRDIYREKYKMYKYI